MKEKDVTKQIRDVLKACKVWHFKHFSTLGSMPGVSDIIGCYQGRMIAIEVKTPGWKQPLPGTKAYKHFKEQEGFLFHVNQNGGIGFFASSVETVVEKLGLQVKLFPLFKR